MAERSTLKPVSSSAVPSLVPQGEQAGKPAMPLGRPFTLIGSRNRAHLHLLSSSISRNHAAIISTDTGLYVRDLASRTGVQVNGRKVKEADLHDGEIVQIGSFRFRYTDPSGTTRLGLAPKPAAAMLEIDGTTLTPIDGRTILIGRRPTCDIPLPEASVSNTHAMVFEINGQRFIRDLGSRTGTLVNGKPVHHQELEFGDEVRIGDTQFRYVSAVAPAAPAELEPGELEHEEDEEPIGLAFADEEPAHASAVESIPEADIDDLLADGEAPAATEEEPVHEPASLEPIALESVAEEPGHSVAPEESAPEDREIDFEIAGSQLDLQKKLEETSRLAAHEEEPPLHAVTASDEVLRPVEDLGLDFIDDTAPPAFASETIPQEEPVEEAPLAVAERAQGAGEPVEARDHDPLALEPEPVELTALGPEPSHRFSAPPDVVPAIDEDATVADESLVPIDSELATSEPEETEAAPATADHVLTSDDLVVSEPHLEISGEPIEAELPAAPEPIAEAIELAEEVSEPEPVAPPHVEPENAESETVAEVTMAPPPAEAEATIAPAVETEPAPSAAEPVDVEAIDLSAVDFRGEVVSAGDLAPVEEEPAPAPAEPAPILDLVPEAPAPAIADEVAATAEVASPVEPVVEPEPQPAKGRGKRPRKPRGRKKKAEAPAVAEAAAAEVAEAPSVDLPVAEITAVDSTTESHSSEVVEPSATTDVQLPDAAPTEISCTTEPPSEVIPATDPTPESAQELGETIDEVASPALDPEAPTTDALTDTTFGRIVEEFAGPEAQPIVEQPVALAETASEPEIVPAADAQATIPDEGVTAVEPEPLPDHAEPVSFSGDQALDISADEGTGQALTSDVSVDDVIELDSSALLDDSESVAPAEPVSESIECGQETPAPEHSGSPESHIASDEPLTDLPAEIPRAFVSEEASSLASPEPAEAPPVPRPPVDPFFGMERDMGSFLGGIPWALPTSPVPIKEPPAASPFSQSAPVQQPEDLVSSEPAEGRFEELLSLSEENEVAELPETSGEPTSFVAPEVTEPEVSSHAAPAPPTMEEVAGLDELPDLEALPGEEKLNFTEEEDELPPLDTLLADDSEPLELFDGASAKKLDELPDSMEAIGDVNGVLAEERVPPEAPAPKPQSKPAPVGPPPAPLQTPAKPPASPFATSAPPPAPAPAKPKFTPPPPPRTSPLRSFAGNPFQLSSEEVELPEPGGARFAGDKPAKRGQAPSFEGLAMPPVREADVFSNAAFQGIDDVFFGQAAGQVPEIPTAGPKPTKGKAQSGAPSMAPPDAALPGTPAAGKRDRKRNAIPPNRQALPARAPGQPPVARPPGPPPQRPLAQPAAPEPLPPGTPKRVPWWKKVRTLLPLMIVCLLAAWLGIIFAMGPKHQVQGLLRFEGLENLDQQANKRRIDGIHQLIRDPDVRTIAIDNAKNSGAPGGFVEDPAAMENLSQSDKTRPDYSEFEGGRQALVLHHTTNQADVDRVRMKAVLAAIYSRDGSQRDSASSAKGALEAAQKKLDAAGAQQRVEREKLAELEARARTSGAAPTPEMIQGPALWATGLEEKNKQLLAAWQNALEVVQQRKATLESAQSPTTSSSATVDVENDPDVRRLKSAIESLNTRIRAARGSGTDAAQEPSAVLASALDRLDSLLSSTPDSNDPAVNAYLANARGTRDEVQQILARTRADAQTAEQLLEQLSQSLPTGEVTDPALRDLLRERDMNAHHYEAATGSGLTEDATKIKGVIEDLDLKIDARRKAIGGAAVTNSGPSHESIAQLEQNRTLDAQRIRDRLNRLDQGAPKEDAIPAAARKQIAPILRAVSVASSAADRFAASGQTRQQAGDVSKLETQLATDRSQLDQKRKDLADAAAGQLNGKDRQARDAAVAKARRDLAEANIAADGAAQAYDASLNLLSLVRDLSDQRGRLAAAEQQLKSAQQEFDERQQNTRVTAALVAPDDTAVTVTYEEDKRLKALGGASLLIVGIFGILMWRASSHHSGGELPFAKAVAIAHDVPGHLPEDFAASEMFEHDDGEPIIA